MSRPLSVEGRTYVYSSSITYINNGDRDQSLEPDLIRFNIFMNTSWQTASLEKVSKSYTLTRDADGNQVIVFSLPELPPGGNATISYSIRLEERMRSPPNIGFASGGNLSDIPEGLRQEYYEAEGSWLVDDDLRSLANSIWASQGMTTNVLRIVTSLADWIGKNVKSANHDVPYYPNETYSSLEGDCDDQANLLITLCRVLGIPAYLQIGCLRWSSRTETYWGGHVTSRLKDVTYHAWAVIYVPPWGWLPFDMTLGWSSHDSLSVIRSARAWSLDAMPLLNVTRSDWAGDGRTQKAKIMISSINIYYEDALAALDQEGLHMLTDWRFWSIVAVASSVSIITWLLYSKRLKLIQP